MTATEKKRERINQLMILKKQKLNEVKQINLELRKLVKWQQQEENKMWAIHTECIQMLKQTEQTYTL